MQTFTVHEPRHRPADRIERAEQLVFIKDGFSFGAALLAPFWMIAHRLWLPLLGYVAALVLIEVVGWIGGWGDEATGWIIIGLHMLIGYEADGLRRWGLARRGFAFVGSVSGRNSDDCERRFFEAWLKEQPFVPSEAVHGGTARIGIGRLSSLTLLPRRI